MSKLLHGNRKLLVSCLMRGFIKVKPQKCMSIAPDQRGVRLIFYFSMKMYVVGTHLMSTHNIHFHGEIKYYLIPHLIFMSLIRSTLMKHFEWVLQHKFFGEIRKKCQFFLLN